MGVMAWRVWGVGGEDRDAFIFRDVEVVPGIFFMLHITAFED